MRRLVPLLAVAILALPVTSAAQEPVDDHGTGQHAASPSFPSSMSP